MASKVRIGIFGAGGIGSSHAKALGTVPDAQIVAMCDTIETRVNEKADMFKVEKRFTDLKKMLKESALDGLIVGVPNAFHAEGTIEGLKAGCHVLCEKPMAMNAAQGRKMVEAAKKAGKAIQMGMVRRFSAESQALRAFAADGGFGKIYHMRVFMRRRRGIPGLGGWFTTKALSGGGGLIDIGVHVIDQVMWLSDNWKPTTASAGIYSKFGSPLDKYVYTGMWAGPPKMNGVFDVDDYATGLVRFASGATLSLEVSWAANAEDGSAVEILGDKGGAKLDKDGVTIYTEKSGRLADMKLLSAQVVPFDLQAANFVAVCQGKAKPNATGEQGVVVMEVLDAIYKSGELGREVKVGGR